MIWADGTGGQIGGQGEFQKTSRRPYGAPATGGSRPSASAAGILPASPTASVSWCVVVAFSTTKERQTAASGPTFSPIGLLTDVPRERRKTRDPGGVRLVATLNSLHKTCARVTTLPRAAKAPQLYET